jgi:hypothetical protein
VGENLTGEWKQRFHTEIDAVFVTDNMRFA